MTPSNANGRTVIEAIGSAVPIVLLISAVGGMALTPLYIMATNNSESIRDLKAKFEAHTLLPSHPVMEMRANAMERRLDDRITVNDRLTIDAAKEVSLLQADFQSEKAKNDSRSIEQETQMDSMAQSLGIQFANTQREMENLQNAMHELGVKTSIAPTGPYYFPNISNRKDKK